jgi:hypothetical protein
MTDSKDDRNKSQPPKPADTSSIKRPHATIDLKATEIVTPNPNTAKPSTTAGPAATVANAAKVEIKPTTGPSGSSTTTSATQSTASNTSQAKSTATNTTAAAAAAARGVTPTASGQSSGQPSGIASLLGAGLVGGILSLVGSTFALPFLGLGDTATTAQEPSPAVARRLGALEQSIRERAAQPATADASAKVAQAEARIVKLEEQARSLLEAQGRLVESNKDLTGKLGKASNDDATARIVKLEEQLTTIAAAADDPQRSGRVPQLAQITGKLSDLETALTTATTTLRRDVAKDVETRMTAANEASEAARSGTQRIDRDLAGIKTESARLGQRTQAIELNLKSLGDDTGTLKTTLESLRGELVSRAKPADVQSALAPVAAKIASLEKNVQGVVKSEQDRNVNAERIVLSLELANLKRALDRGGKFTTELAAVKKVAGTTLDLSALEAIQNEGVATLPALTTEFRSLANTMLDLDAEPADASVVDRLLTGAKSIIRVRKVNHAPGDTSSEAVIGRMEAGLKDGRLADVITEGKKLAPKVVTPAQGWLKRIEARHAVDTSLTGLEAQLKTSLTGSSEPKKGNN